MSTRRSLTATLVLCSLLSLSTGFADISWIHDEVAEETPDFQPRGTATSARAGRQPDVRQLSQAFGHFIGQDISKQGIHLNVDAVVTGIRDGVSGKPAPMSEQEYNKVVSNFRNQHFEELANFNLALADAFMLSNGKRSDIVQAVPGKVQYVVLQKGKGRKVEAHTAPVLRFSGRFIDGTVFTQTEGNQGLPVPLDDMIPGFRQGVIGMQEGEKRRVFIHPEVAYGTSGDIAPNSLLLFEVEVVKAGDRVNSRPNSNQSRSAVSQRNIQPVTLDDWDLVFDEEDEDDSDFDEDDDDEFVHHVTRRHRFIQPVALQAKADHHDDDNDDSDDNHDDSAESDWDDIQPQKGGDTSPNTTKFQSRYNYHPHR